MRHRLVWRHLGLLSVLLVGVVLGVVPTTTHTGSLPPAPLASGQERLLTAATFHATPIPAVRTTDPSSGYSATLTATANATATSVTISSTTPWTVSGNSASLTVGTLLPQILSWNGTTTLALAGQLQFAAGQEKVGLICGTTVGSVWANLTYRPIAGIPFIYHWSAVIDSYQTGTGTCPTYRVELAPSWTTGAPANGTYSLTVACTSYAGYSFALLAPAGLKTQSVAGTRGTNALVSGSPPLVATSMPFAWGWHWSPGPTTTSPFTFAPAAASGYIVWVSPYKVNATYNSGTQADTTGGTFTGSLSHLSILFGEDPVGAPTGTVPFIRYSFPVTYTVFTNVTAPFLVTYNYTIGASTTTTTLAATTVVPYNATFSLYTYSAETPYGSTTKVTMAANHTWTFVNAWPAGYTYYAGNNTAYWHTPIPNETQTTYIAPTIYDPATLTVVYVPLSPVFSLFGAALPYSSVLTYINGIFAPYATVSVQIGTTYDITTFDVFGVKLADTNVTVTIPAQVAQINLNIWPMTVADMNSSYVIGILLTNNSLTQTAPDIMPLGSETFYLPAGTYTVTLNYLLLNTPSIAKTITFTLSIAGVSYSVVTGLTFLNIQTTTINVGQNISKLVQFVNATLIDTNTSINSLVASIQNGLFAFHLNLGTGTKTKNIYSFPVFVTNGANGAVNGTITQAVQTNLQATYINSTGSVAANFYVSSPTVGSFNLFLSPTANQIAEVSNGLGVFVLTSMVQVGGLTVVAAGVVGASALNSAVAYNQPVVPLNQQLLLNLYNTTRNSTGFTTSSATWTNPTNGTFAGQLVLTGSWLSNAQQIQVLIDGSIIPNASYSVSPSEILVFAGVANISAGHILTVEVTYLATSQITTTTTVAMLGPIPLTGLNVYALLAIVAVIVSLVNELLRGSSGLTIVLGVFFLLVGAMLAY